MRQVSIMAILGALVLAQMGCGTRCPPDIDGEMTKPLRITPGVLIPADSINAKCDSVDWKHISYYTDARLTVDFTFGDMGKEHGVRGEISLLDFNGNILQRQPIVPEQRVYTFVFVAKKEKDYFFKVQAEKGRSGYMVKATAEPLDPCASCPPNTTCCRPTNLCCEPGTVCKDGACVKLEVCNCGPGEVCVSGRCEEACPGGCRRGFVCDEATRTCIRKKSPGPPPQKEEPRRPQPPKCGPSERLDPETMRCVPAEGVLRGQVLSATDAGGEETVIMINLGSSHNVKVGSSGSVAGHSFRVDQVWPTRCRAKVKGAKPQDLINKPVTITP